MLIIYILVYLDPQHLSNHLDIWRKKTKNMFEVFFHKSKEKRVTHSIVLASVLAKMKHETTIRISVPVISIQNVDLKCCMLTSILMIKIRFFCLFVHDNIQYKASSYRPIEKWLIISKLYDIYLFMINKLTD